MKFSLSTLLALGVAVAACAEPDMDSVSETTTVEENSRDVGKWSIATMEDASGYGDVVLLQQASGSTVPDQSAANDVTPVLMFECRPADASVIAKIDWQRFISSFSTEVGFKVDGGRFTWLKWKVDSSENVTLSPSATDTEKLIAALISGSDLLVEVTPYSEGPVTASYDVSGLPSQLEKLKTRCQ